jgi:hypothetical protein
MKDFSVRIEQPYTAMPLLGLKGSGMSSSTIILRGTGSRTGSPVLSEDVDCFETGALPFMSIAVVETRKTA